MKTEAWFITAPFFTMIQLIVDEEFLFLFEFSLLLVVLLPCLTIYTVYRAWKARRNFGFRIELGRYLIYHVFHQGLTKD